MSLFAEAFERERVRCPTAQRLTRRSGKFSETPSTAVTAQPWLPSGKRPQRLVNPTTHDWFDALIEYKQSPSERNLQILRAARSKVQQTARRCANEYWAQLSQDIQTAAITGNIRGMYDGIKKALGPTQSKTVLFKSSVGR